MWAEKCHSILVNVEGEIEIRLNVGEKATKHPAKRGWQCCYRWIPNITVRGGLYRYCVISMIMARDQRKNLEMAGGVKLLFR